MKKNRHKQAKRGFLFRIPAVDLILLIILLILFVQMFIILIENPADDTETLDVIPRSLSAMIFGYFVAGSAQENRTDPKSTSAVSNLRLEGGTGDGVQLSKIGFSNDVPEETVPDVPTVLPAPPANTTFNPTSDRIWIVGGIGVLSLALIFMVRNIPLLHRILATNSGIAMLSQLRDFAAGSICFLVNLAGRRIPE